MSPVSQMRWLSCVLVSFAAVGTLSGQTSTVISVDANKVFQTMAGFGASERVFDDPHVTDTFDPKTERSAVVLTATQQNEILDRLYVDLGFTRVRPTIERGIEVANDKKFNFAWKRTDAHVEYVKRAVQRGVNTFFLSPISLESWMGRSSGRDVADYVDWAMAQIRRWRQLGVEIPFYSVSNEPTNVGLSGEFIRDVIKLMGPKLAAEAFATRFVITDDVNPQAAYEGCRVILSDPIARRYVGAMASHLYGSLDMSAMSALAKEHGLPLWMTEFSRGGRDAFNYASLMSDLMTQYDVSAIDYMWGFFGTWESGTQLVRLKYNDKRFADYSPTDGPVYRGYETDGVYYTIGQFSRFVRPGSRRIGAESNDAAVKVAAFRSAADLIVVIVNEHNERTANISLGGVTGATRLRTIRTTPSENWRELPMQTFPSTTFTSVVPAQSVTTFIVTPTSSAR